MNKSKLLPLLFTILIIGILSCKKGGMLDCFKSSGPTVKQERSVGDFSSITLKNNLNLFLIQDSSDKVFVEAGENLQSGIKTNITGKNLTIQNDNSCNWVRSYDKPLNVYVHFSKLDSIEYRSSGDIISNSQIVSDTFLLKVYEGGGSIQLNINSEKSLFHLMGGTVDLNVTGWSHINFISSDSYGPVNCLGLQTSFTFLSSRSTNDCYINVGYEMDIKIGNVGNVYYMGNPINISSEITGTGKLIKLD